MKKIKAFNLQYILQGSFVGLITLVGVAFGNEVDPNAIYPQVNAFGVPVGDSITVEFSGPINPSDFLDPEQFRISGSLTGTYPLDSTDVTFPGNNKVVFRNKFYPFKAGEKITIELNPGIVDSSTSWSFIADAGRGTAEFDPWPNTPSWSAGELGVSELKGLMFGDVDGDQWPDMLILTDSGVKVLKNLHDITGSPIFDPSINWNINDPVSPEAAILVDLDLDGDLDLCFTDKKEETDYYYLNWYENDISAGMGFTNHQSILLIDKSGLREIQAWNFYQDNGLPDIVVLDEEQWQLLFFENNGSLTLRDIIQLNEPDATSIQVGQWSASDIMQPEIVIAYYQSDHESWCNLGLVGQPTLNGCMDLSYNSLSQPSKLRVAPIYRESASYPPGREAEAADFAIYNSYNEESPSHASSMERGTGIGLDQATSLYDTLYVYRNEVGNPFGSGTWEKMAVGIKRILSLAVADFDSGSHYPDNMGFAVGGPDKFKVIEDLGHEFTYNFSPGSVTEIATADLDRRGSTDLGMIVMHEINNGPTDQDRVYLFRNRCTTDPDLEPWCPLPDTVFSFPQPIDACTGCDSMLVPLTPRYDFPIIINAIGIDSPFVITNLPTFPDTLYLADTLWLEIRLCPGPGLTANTVEGYLTVETTEGTCETTVRADIRHPQVTVQPDPIILSAVAGCSDSAQFSITSDLRAIVEGIMVSSPFQLADCPFPDTLEAGIPKTCTIRFNAEGCGTWNDNLQIFLCGGDTVEAQVTGTTSGPRVFQNTSPIEIGPIPEGTSASASLCAKNNNNCDQAFTLSLSNTNYFHFDPSPPDTIVLPPGDSLCLDVVFTPPSSACSAAFDSVTTVKANFFYSPYCPPDSLRIIGHIGCSELAFCDGVSEITSYDFGPVRPGEWVEKWFSVVDPGMFDTDITNRYGLGSPFSVTQFPSLPYSLTAGSECADNDTTADDGDPSDRILEIRFTAPQAAGIYQDTLFLESNATGSPHRLILSGESRLPNLVVDLERATSEPVKAKKPMAFNLTVSCFDMDYPDSFDVRVDVPGIYADTCAFQSMRVVDPPQRWDCDNLIVFPSAGNYIATATIFNVSNENTAGDTDTLNIMVGGDLYVWPNPFTPNGDGKNDEIYFDISEIQVSSPEVRIFSMANRLVRTLVRIEEVQGLDVLRWDGKDNHGHDLKPGIYLWVFDDATAGHHRGTIALAR